jgi:predicted aspartyl protease
VGLLHIPFRRGRSAGEEHLRANRFPEAEQAFAAEAAANPGDARPHLALGHLDLMRNDLALAEEHLEAAVARDRKCREANELLAEVSYRRDDFNAAATHQEAAGNSAVAAKLRSFAGRRPYAIEGPDNVRLSFVRTEPLPVLAASVNGGPEAHFLLDTGGAELILDSAFAQSAGIPLFGGQRSFFGGGKTATIVHGAADSLALGDLTIRNVPVHVLNLGPIGPEIGEPGLAGIIGTCLLYRFLATIDYPGEALLLRRKTTRLAAPSAEAIEVPFQMADDHFMLAEGRLNDGPPTLYLVDSGLGGGAFTCPASTLQEAGIERGSTQTVEGQGGGGAMSAWPFDVASLSLGKARREGLQGIAGAFPPQLEWAYGFRIGGLVSHGFLCAYAVTFDFERMTIRLEPGR